MWGGGGGGVNMEDSHQLTNKVVTIWDKLEILLKGAVKNQFGCVVKVI